MHKLTLAILATSGVLFFSSLAHAGDLFLRANPSGAQEVPEVVTTNGGGITARANPELTQVTVRLRVREVGGVTAVHPHCSPAGVNGPLALGLITPGPCAFSGNSLVCTLASADVLADAVGCEASIGTPVNNIASLVAAIRDGDIYVNVHTNANPMGESPSPF